MSRKGEGGVWAVILFICVAALIGIFAHALNTPHQEPEWYDALGGEVEVNASDRMVRHAVAEDGQHMYNFYTKQRTFSKDVFQQVEYKYSGDQYITHGFYDSETEISTIEVYKYEGTLSHSQYGDIEVNGCPVNWYCEEVKQ